MNRKRRWILLAAVAAAGLMAAAPSRAGDAPYRLTKTIPLGGGLRWDYLAFDPTMNRVYVSHGTELDVLDASSAAVIGHVTGLDGSHGVAVDPQTGLGYADSARTESTTIFDLKTLKPVGKLPALADADGMAYEPTTRQVYVVGGDANAVLAYDTRTNKPETKIALGGSPESMVVDGAGSVYIDISDKNEIVRIDARKNEITGRWPIAPCKDAVGLAVDPAARRLFATCHNAVMVIADADTGAVITSLPIGKGTDSAAFDPVRKRAFSSNKDGTLSVVQENGPDSFTLLDTVQTAPGARTLAVDGKTGRVFLVTAKVEKAGPPKYAGGPPNYTFKPGTVAALIFDPVR